MEVQYDGSVYSLFSILDKVFTENKLPEKIIRTDYELSCNTDMPLFFEQEQSFFVQKPKALVPCSSAYNYFNPCKKSLSGQEIIKYSGRAYKDILYAWMSELPIEREIINFAWKIVSAGKMDEDIPKKSKSAEKARNDLADPDVKKVINAASKARGESHFFMGILRFTIGPSNVPIAKCSPDHFILPTLAHYFTLRFGNSNWAIIDEKRNISLVRAEAEPAKLVIFDPADTWVEEETYSGKEGFDVWEKMWKNYHTSINNESRSNPNLQRSFIPVRYWKYLPELNDKT